MPLRGISAQILCHLKGFDLERERMAEERKGGSGKMKMKRMNKRKGGRSWTMGLDCTCQHICRKTLWAQPYTDISKRRRAPVFHRDFLLTLSLPIWHHWGMRNPIWLQYWSENGMDSTLVQKHKYRSILVIVSRVVGLCLKHYMSAFPNPSLNCGGNAASLWVLTHRLVASEEVQEKIVYECVFSDLLPY